MKIAPKPCVGGLAPNAKWRKQVVNYGRPEVKEEQSEESGEDRAEDKSRYIEWSELMRRTFGLDVLACPNCGGRMKLIALIEKPSVIKKILMHLNLPTDLPRARPPPKKEQLVIWDDCEVDDPESYAE